MGKILFLLTVVMILSAACFGQQTVALTDRLSVDLPNGTQKVTKEQALTHVRNKFKGNEILERSYAMHNTDKIYKADDILVYFVPSDGQAPKGHLSYLKKGLDEWHSKDTSYTANLENDSNKSVLVIKYSVNNVGHYIFFCYNINNTKSLNGGVDFDMADKTKATAILDHLLNSIKFKD